MIGTVINSGRYGTVRSFFNKKLNKNVAIKILPKKRNDILDRKNSEMINREIIAWKELTGQKNILELYDIFEDDENIYFMSEKCKDHNINELNVFNLTDKEKKHISKSILNGIHQCHSRNYSHGDIKPANILMNENNIIKLCDFGNSLQTHHNNKGLFGFKGTPFYCSPEIMSRYNEYGKNIDIWSLGIIIYQFYHYNKHPFYTKGLCHILYIDNSKIEWEYDLDKNTKDFILQCLNFDKDNRMNSEEALKHPFIKSII